MDLRQSRIATRQRVGWRILWTFLGAFASLLFAEAAVAQSGDPGTSLASAWIVDGARLRQIDAASHQVITGTVLLDRARSVSVDPLVGAVSVLSAQYLTRLDSAGSQVFRLELRDLGQDITGGAFLLANPYDGSVWIGTRQAVVRVNNNGSLVFKSSRINGIRAMATGLDQSIWVVSGSEVHRLSANGQWVASLTIPGAKALAVDAIAERLWVLTDASLMQFDARSPAAALNTVPLPGAAQDLPTAIAFDAVGGRLWVARTGSLLAFDRAAQLLAQTALPADLGAPQSLVHDYASATLWLSVDGVVAHLTEAGAVLARIPVAVGETAVVGAAAIGLVPSLRILAPQEGAITNSPAPTVRLAVGALCNGMSCSPGGAYFDRLTVQALLDNVAIGNQFAIAGAEAIYTPPAPLTEGGHTLSAELSDAFGNRSSAVTTRFTVDTIPPRFLSLAPADGSVFTSPQVTVQGAVDDPAAVVVLRGVGPATATSTTDTQLNFSIPVTLAPGPNPLVLSAVDRASNNADAALRLTYAPVSVSVAIASPANGDVIAGSTAAVSGSFQGPANTGITVNGSIAAQNGNQFYAIVGLQPGANAVTVTATAPDGSRVQQSVSVTSSGIAAVEVSATAISGMAPFQADFQVTAGVGVRRIEADFDGNGSVDQITTNPNSPLAYSYAQPGVYLARFTVTDVFGNVTTQTMQITVEGVAAVDARVRAVYLGMLARLRAGDIEAALAAVTEDSREKYRRVFNALQPNPAQVVDQLGVIADGSLSHDIAEYLVVRDTPFGPQAFLIYLIRGEDGVWRIEAM